MSQLGMISLKQLSLMLIPISVMVLIFFRMGLDWKNLIYASIRMISQLIIVGFALNIIFAANHFGTSILIFSFMLVAAAWIASRTHKKRTQQFPKMIVSLLCGSTPTLLIVLVFVMPNDSWYQASYFIPLAGMTLANAMNALALASDRLYSELDNTNSLDDPFTKSLETALIPTINSFLAVGLVSLPGMMTGQILSGVSPLIAVRYQIMIMAMVLGAAGLSTAVYLFLEKKNLASKMK